MDRGTETPKALVIMVRPQMTGSDPDDRDGVMRNEGGKTPFVGCNGKGVGEAVKFVASKPTWLVIPLTQRVKTRLPDGWGGSQHLRVGRHKPDFLVCHPTYRQATSSSHRPISETTVVQNKLE